MRGRAAFGIIFYFTLFYLQNGWSVEVKPMVSYEFTVGSQEYYSHGGMGGALFKFKKPVKISALYSLFTDTDYSLIQSGTLRIKGSVKPETDLEAAVIFSGGKLKDSPTTSSSTSLDFAGTKFLDQFEASAGYRYTSGSLSAGINREVRVTRGRKTETKIVQEEISSHYTAHTLSSSAGYSFADKWEGFFASLRLAITFNSDSSRIYSEGLETAGPLPHQFFLGLSYTLTQNSNGTDRNYFALSLAKYF